MKYIQWIAIMSMFVLVVGCSKQQQQSVPDIIDQQDVEVITIGVLVPFSGARSSYGEDVVTVVERFGEVFNNTRSDVQVAWVIEDSACNNKDVVRATEKLIHVDQVDVIIGGVCAEEMIAAATLAQQAGTLIISLGPASSLGRKVGDWVVSIDTTTALARALDSYTEQAYTKVLMLVEQKDILQDIADKVADAIAIDMVRINFSPNERDMQRILQQIQQDNTDALFILTDSDETNISLVSMLEQQGLLSMFEGHVYGISPLLTPVFIEEFGSTVDGFKEIAVVLPLDPLVLDTAYTESIEKYVVSSDTLTLMQVADAMRMIILAVEGGAMQRPDFKEFVYYFNENEPYRGYMGRYWFDTHGAAVGMDFGIYEVDNSNVYLTE